MDAESDVRLAYSRFIELGQGMAAAGHFEVSYYALCAALHCAEDAEDTTRLAEVADLLRHYQRMVDAISPPHRLSARAAHGARGIFTVGVGTAEAVIKRLESQQYIQRLKDASEQGA